MKTSDEVEMALVNNARLEKENRALRQSLWDQYAAAALSGLLAYYGDQHTIVTQDTRTALAFAAADHADLLLEQRALRVGAGS